MEKGHGFKEEHGFSGSAHEGKSFHAEVPGYKRGSMVKHAPHMSHTVMPDTSNDDEMSTPIMPPSGQGFRHGGRVEHDDHPKHDHVKYDRHGFASHKKHKE